MRSSFHSWPRAVAAFVFVFLVLGKSAEAVDDVGSIAVRCERAITSAGHAFTARQLSDLGRCAAAVLSCVETPADDPECVPRAANRCERMVARVLRRETKLARSIAIRCAAVDLEVLLGSSGLGFADLAPLCPALGTGHGNAAVVGDCVAGLQRCRGERLLAAMAPRAGELLRAAGVPTEVRAALVCLDDRGGSGGGARDADVGVAVVRCGRSMVRAAARLVTRTLANVSLCTSGIRTCLETPDAPASCLGDAATACRGAFLRMGEARHGFERALAAACSANRVDFAALAAATGINLAALADECAAVDVASVATLPALTECLVRKEECELEGLVRQSAPRADELLALVGETLTHPFCEATRPTATPAPSPTPPPLPTATTTGPTRTPRPGESATPTARITPSPEPSATPFCGNDRVDDGEECDGDHFVDDSTCEDLCFESAPDGTLACTDDCKIDFTDCHGEDCEAP